MRTLGLVIAASAASSAMARAHARYDAGRGAWSEASRWTRLLADAWQALTEDACLNIAGRVLA